MPHVVGKHLLITRTVLATCLSPGTLVSVSMVTWRTLSLGVVVFSSSCCTGGGTTEERQFFRFFLPAEAGSDGDGQESSAVVESDLLQQMLLAACRVNPALMLTWLV